MFEFPVASFSSRLAAVRENSQQRNMDAVDSTERNVQKGVRLSICTWLTMIAPTIRAGGRE